MSGDRSHGDDGGPADLRRHFAALRYDGGYAYDCISGSSGASGDGCLAD